MAQGRVQSIRSQTKAVRPAAGSRQPGELYVNFADRQIGFIDQAKAAKDLVAIRYFSPTTDYASGDFVIQAGELYQAKASVAAGAFVAAQWDAVINAADLAAALGTTSGDLAGQIGIKNWLQATAYAAGDLVVNNDLIYQAKAAINAGTAWNASLWNDFTAAQSVADKTVLPSQPRTGMLVYNTATGKLAYLTSSSTQVNASGAKTVVAASAPGGSTLDAGDFWWNSSQGSMSLWDGSQFKAVGGGVQVYDNIPPNTSQGALWWESDTGNLYVSFDDGNTTQWVQVNAAQGSPNAIYSSDADMYAGFKTSGNAFIVNDKADGTGTNIMTVSETGFLTAASSIVAGAGITATNGNFASSAATAILCATAGAIYLRPNGLASATGEVNLASNGNLGTNGNITIAGNFYSVGSTFSSTTANVILAAASPTGAVYLRPIGAASASGQWTLNNVGQQVCTNASQYKPGAGGFTDSSDERIKTVIGAYEHGLAEVLALEPVRFTYNGNDTREPPESRTATPYAESHHLQAAEEATEFIGLVAQQAETVMPEMVQQISAYIDGEPVDDLRVLDNSALVYALVNAVKTLTARIEALEGGAR